MNPELKLAIKLGNVDKFLRLITDEHDMTVTDSDGETILTLVDIQNNLEMLNAVLSKKPNINAKNLDGDSALMIAVKWGNLEMVEALLKAKASVTRRSKLKNTPLIMAATHGEVEIAEELLRDLAPSDVCKPNPQGTTPLMIAAARGQVKMINLLLKKGALDSIHLHNIRHGDTALLLSVKEGHYDATEVLLSAGARIEDENSNGESALTLATRLGDLAIIELLKAKIMAEELKKAQALAKEDDGAAKTTRDGFFRPPSPELTDHFTDAPIAKTATLTLMALS